MMDFGYLAMTTDGQTPSWSEIARTQGIAWVLLVMILMGIGVAAKQVYSSVPVIVNTINSGYERNSQELAKSAEVFRQAAVENRTFLQEIVNDFKIERLRDQHMMIELIRRGDVSSETVVEAMEAAAEAVPDDGDF